MNLKKKIVKILIFLTLVISCIQYSYCGTTTENLNELDQNIQSEAAIIIEKSTGKIIYEKNSKEKKYPASTTKILTAIITLEECNIDETAVASENAITSIPSGYATANIQIGESLTVKDLLYALMLKSANESAVILAEHISGSVEEFSKLMNEKAKQIGCKDTNFVNPNGIHNQNHYTTAYDMALIAKYCMENETFRKIVSTTSYTLPATNLYQNEDRTFSNTNSLIIINNNNREDNYYYKYATGIKTGFTSQAKNCLVASAEKNDMEFITVVLGANVTIDGLSQRYINTISMFEFAFNNYSFKKVKDEGNFIENIEIPNATEETKRLELVTSEDITALMSIDTTTEEIVPEIILNENLEAPINKGDKVGKIKYEIEGITYEADLIANNDVEEKMYIKIFYIIIAIIILILIGGYIRIKNIKVNKHCKYTKK